MWLIGPAAHEQGVDGRRTELRFVESNAGLQLIDHLTVLQPEERLLGHGEDLPNAHTCGPTKADLFHRNHQDKMDECFFLPHQTSKRRWPW